MKLSTITLPATVVSLDFVFPDFLTQFSVYNWILPEATDTTVDDDLDVNLDYNSAMLQDYFEEERAELEALEEAEYFETATILPDTITDLQSNQRRMKRYKELPNLVPQMADYNEMDQAWTLLNMLAFSLDMNGIKDATAHMFSSYGCWCNFKKGEKGPVIDEIDARCKARVQCRKCVEMDDKCGWNEHNYNVLIDTKPKKPQLTCNHQKNRQESCRMNSCECDLAFVNNVIDLVQTSNTYDSNYGRYLNVDTCNQGETGQATQGTENACCGVHPARFPFNNSKRSCCGERTYDPSFYDCCEDETISAIGDC